MTLEPVQGVPGLWKDPAWDGLTPGTHAYVVGVSKYDHLDGSDQAYGLGQLEVSASTAWEFFNWLCDEYEMADAPLVQCWLLLSPTDSEAAATPDMTAHAFAPTWQACEDSLTFWKQELEAQSQARPGEHRALFFFTGHGIEVAGNQVLLPSDYLAPPGRITDRAISTENTRGALNRLELGELLLFIDACRSATPELAQTDLNGWELFRWPRQSSPYNKRNEALYYASSDGTSAYQPHEGLSLFGEALMEGLRGEQGMKLTQVGKAWHVHFHPLETHLKLRLPQLLRGQNAPEDLQLPKCLPVTTDVDPTVATLAQPVAPRSSGIRFGRRFRLPSSIQPPAPVLPAVPEITLNRPDGLLANSTSFGDLHDIFRHEDVTVPWNEARVMNLKTGQWMDDALRLERVMFEDATTSYTVVLSTPEVAGDVWLQLSELGIDRQSIAVLLPDDASEPGYHVPPRFEIRFSMKDNHFATFRAGLAEAQELPPMETARQLWTRLMVDSTAETADSEDITELESILRDKRMSPLSATIAAIILLRANRLDRLHDWLGNLTDWFPERPDGPALFAEQLFRQGYETTFGNQFILNPLAEVLNLVWERGLPRSSDAFDYAFRLSGHLADAWNWSDMRDLHEAMKPAARYKRASGLFTVFIGPPDEVVPEKLRIGPSPI